MPEVTALHSFDHNGVKRRGQVWDASESETVQLERAGLVKRRDNTAIPPKATGKKLSASPAVPASPKQTSTKSNRGAKSKPAAPSSSPTPAIK